MKVGDLILELMKFDMSDIVLVRGSVYGDDCDCDWEPIKELYKIGSSKFIELDT